MRLNRRHHARSRYHFLGEATIENGFAHSASDFYLFARSDDQVYRLELSEEEAVTIAHRILEIHGRQHAGEGVPHVQ